MIPKRFKGTGLNVYCNKCGKTITKKCPALKGCNPNTDWVYKMVVYYSDYGKKKRKTRVCISRELNEAYQELLRFREEVKGKKSQNLNNSEYSLMEGVQAFLDKKFNRGEHKRTSKTLSQGHREDILRILGRFIDSLEVNGIDTSKMMLSDLGPNVLSLFYSHIEKFGKSNSMTDRHTRIMRSFLQYLSDRGMYSKGNFFRTVDCTPIKSSPEAISDEEFENVLKAIKPENGKGTKGASKNKDYHRDWLEPLLRIVRYTGGRVEEVFELKWENLLKIDIQGKAQQLVIFHNLKVERQKGNEVVLKVVPVSKELSDVLEEVKNSEFSSEKIIETGLTFKSYRSFISRAFTHFYKKAYPNREKHKVYNQIRKAKITDLSAVLGEDAYKLSGHSGKAILDKHYVDKLQAAIKLLELQNATNGDS